MTLANEAYLFLLLPVIPIVIWYILKGRKSRSAITIPATSIYHGVKRSYKYYLIHLPFILEVVAYIMLVIILSRPQTTDKWEDSEIEGIDIMLCMDISTSMLAEDLKPNRLEAAKSVATSFINGRPNDNIGLTLFAGESFTQCPMTVDHTILLNMLHDVSSRIVLSGAVSDGTAIGMGLVNAIGRLKESSAKSKVIIILTDGTNNMGEISPLTAAEMAKTFGIRIYTIGVGSNGTAPYPVQTVGGHVQYVNMPVEIDESMLRQIANTTNGIYYRATSNERLIKIYEEIDKLERTKLMVKEYSRNQEAFEPFAWVLLISLLLSIVLKQTLLRGVS